MFLLMPPVNAASIGLMRHIGRGIYRLVSAPVGTVSGIADGVTRGLYSTSGKVAVREVVEGIDGTGMKLCKKLSNAIGDFFATGRANIRQATQDFRSSTLPMLERIGSIPSALGLPGGVLGVLAGVVGVGAVFSGIALGNTSINERSNIIRQQSLNPCQSVLIQTIETILGYTRAGGILLIPFIGLAPGMVIAGTAFVGHLVMLPIQKILGGGSILHRPEDYLIEPFSTWAHKIMGNPDYIHS